MKKGYFALSAGAAALAAVLIAAPDWRVRMNRRQSRHPRLKRKKNRKAKRC